MMPTWLCNDLKHYFGMIHPATMFCFGYDRGGIDSCQVFFEVLSQTLFIAQSYSFPYYGTFKQFVEKLLHGREVRLVDYYNRFVEMCDTMGVVD